MAEVIFFHVSTFDAHISDTIWKSDMPRFHRFIRALSEIFFGTCLKWEIKPKLSRITPFDGVAFYSISRVSGHSIENILPFSVDWLHFIWLKQHNFFKFVCQIWLQSWNFRKLGSYGFYWVTLKFQAIY
jgi:hypothetical protein